jgi:hypothetical protein
MRDTCRYRITLGTLDVSKLGHLYTLEDLPNERFTIGFAITDTSQPARAIYQARPFRLWSGFSRPIKATSSSTSRRH